MPEYYNSLDAPVYIWNKVHDTGDLSWLLVKRQKVSKRLKSALEKAWDNIYNEYISEFGFSENFLAIKYKGKQIEEMNLKMIITGDRSLSTFIDIEKLELEELKASVTTYTPAQIAMLNKKAIERNYKFQINMHMTSIREFHSYLQDLN